MTKALTSLEKQSYVFEHLPISLSVSLSALIRVSDTPAISREVMNNPDITLATTTPRLSIKNTNHIPDYRMIVLFPHPPKPANQITSELMLSANKKFYSIAFINVPLRFLLVSLATHKNCHS